MQAQFWHYCYGTYGVSWRYRALIISEWRESIQVMHLNTTSCISHIVFEYTCSMIPCNWPQNVWNTEGKLLSVAIRMYTEHNLGLRSSGMWCSAMGGVVTDVSKECSFETSVNKPKDIWVTSKRTWVPITLLRENHVTCNINLLQFYMAICETAITLLVPLLRYVAALNVSLPSFFTIFTSVDNWRFPMVSLYFFNDITIPAALWPWVRLSLSTRNVSWG